MDSLEILVKQLWAVGITEIFVDGSFVEDKDHPADIDGYFGCELSRLADGSLVRDLNALDPFKVWDWAPESRRRFHDEAKWQLPMWHQYRVELFPHVGQSSGILDGFGNEAGFPSAFRVSRRTGGPRGIVCLKKEGSHDPH